MNEDSVLTGVWECVTNSPFKFLPEWDVVKDVDKLIITIEGKVFHVRVHEQEKA